jgi:DNA-binding NtrC family response regulator
MTHRGRILIVDDEANARTALAELLRDEGFQVETAADGFKALPKVEEFGPDLLLTDLKMPGLDGLELMRKARESDPDIAAVVMTAYGAIDTAVAAMRQGAADYLTKPINVDELLIVMERVLERQRLHRESGILRERLSERHRIQNIVGSCAAMQRVLETVLQVAPSRASVLISGESGTGKELIAAAIHEHSPRSTGPFVKLHCAALADSLLESELFGHERGAFTGAAGRRDGRFHQADGGTLFLDEIGEIPASTQIKLLRFLQEREFERVGGNQTIKVDVRIVAATNRDLAQLVREGKFREDLYYRLNVVSIEVPPLRARSSDTPLLATHFLRKYTAENGRGGLPVGRDRARGSGAQHLDPGRVGGFGRPHAVGARGHPGRPREVRHPEDARAHRRVDLARRPDARHLAPQDPVPAAGLCGPRPARRSWLGGGPGGPPPERRRQRPRRNPRRRVVRRQLGHPRRRTDEVSRAVARRRQPASRAQRKPMSGERTVGGAALRA